MSPSKKTAKNQYPLPESVDFEAWKARLARLLKHRSPEVDAFNRWANYQSAHFGKIGHSELSSGESLLKEAFELTQPEFVSEQVKPKSEFAATKIRELLPEIESAIGALKATDLRIVPKDGTAVGRFDTLQHSLKTSANEIRRALIVTDRPYMRSPHFLSHCILFLITLDDCGVSEADAYALTSLLMKAHGFSDDELVVFDKGLIKTGTIRKRVKAARQDIRKTELAQKWHLESYHRMVLKRQSDAARNLMRALGLD